MTRQEKSEFLINIFKTEGIKVLTSVTFFAGTSAVVELMTYLSVPTEKNNGSSPGDLVDEIKKETLPKEFLDKLYKEVKNYGNQFQNR